jgi:hypothetical protein
MEHVGMAELRHSSVSDVFCPECQHPMTLVRVLPSLDRQPPLAGFYCQPCHFASTVALKE